MVTTNPLHHHLLLLIHALHVISPQAAHRRSHSRSIHDGLVGIRGRFPCGFGWFVARQLYRSRRYPGYKTTKANTAMSGLDHTRGRECGLRSFFGLIGNLFLLRRTRRTMSAVGVTCPSRPVTSKVYGVHIPTWIKGFI